MLPKKGGGQRGSLFLRKKCPISLWKQSLFGPLKMSVSGWDPQEGFEGTDAITSKAYSPRALIERRQKQWGLGDLFRVFSLKGWVSVHPDRFAGWAQGTGIAAWLR